MVTIYIITAKLILFYKKYYNFRNNKSPLSVYTQLYYTTYVFFH
jgi:hypothetical protein